MADRESLTAARPAQIAFDDMSVDQLRQIVVRARRCTRSMATLMRSPTDANGLAHRPNVEELERLLFTEASS